MTAYKSHCLSVVLQLVFWGDHADPVYLGKIKLHRRILVVTLEPARQESAMDLLQLYDEQALDIFVDY